MAHGISKKNKWLLIKFCIPILCIITSITLHDLGSHIYKAHFHTTSSGVGLGFVAFYFTYFIFPSYFAISFMNYKLSIGLALIILAMLFYAWFDTNPLRVILMASVTTLSYFIIIFTKKYIH